MAQVGSYVPAQHACFPIYDCIHSRLSNDDDLERGLSHFACEMRMMGMILGVSGAYVGCSHALISDFSQSMQLAKRSLLIIDELCRSTSQEGTPLAFAIAEEIAANKSTTCFFATHSKELATSLSTNPNTVVLHLSTDVDLDKEGLRLML